MDRRWRTLLLCAPALWMSACGPSRPATNRDAIPGGNKGSGDGTEQPISPAPQAPCSDITVHLIGATQGGVSSLGLVLASVSVSSGTGAVTVKSSPLGATLDLSVAVPRAVGSFAAAANDGPLTVSVSFSGGGASRDGTSSGLSACGAPITFTIPAGRVAAPSARCGSSST